MMEKSSVPPADTSHGAPYVLISISFRASAASREEDVWDRARAIDRLLWPDRRRSLVFGGHTSGTR